MLQCSGERDKSFDIIKRLVDYSSSVAVDDEKFLNTVTTSLNNAAERLTGINYACIPHSVQQKKENENKSETTADIITEEVIESHHDQHIIEAYNEQHVIEAHREQHCTDQHCTNGAEDNENSVLDGTNVEKEVASAQVIFYII